MESVDKFFIPQNRIEHPEGLDYSRVDDFIRTAEAFSRATYQSVYIIDYFKQNFLYVSPNALLIGDLTPDEVYDLNYRFYLNHVPKNELPLLLEINKAGFSFFESTPPENRKDWYIQYNFHVLNNNHPVLIHHKLTPLALTPDNRIWLAICVISISSHTAPGQIEVHRMGSSEFYKYNLKTKRWDKQSEPTLTESEKSVITLSTQGFTMTEIAEKMCLSPDTIKKYRKQIFEKLGVRNISEAIVAATNNKLI